MRFAPLTMAMLLPAALFGQGLRTIPVHRTPFQEPVRAFASGGGTSVAVGDAGSIYSLSESGEWVRRESPATQNIHAVAWTGTQFLAAGNHGTVLTSTDGTAWTVRTSNTTINLAAAASGNGLLVVAGDAGGIFTSPDGSAWTACPTGTTDRITGLAYGGGVFVAVTESGDIFSSSDTVLWTAQSSPASGALSGVAYHAGVFVAVGAAGEIFSSGDGVNWTTRRAVGIERLTNVTATASGFAACGSGGLVLVSPDGLAWSEQSVGGSPLLMAAGEKSGLLTVVSGTGTVWTSSGGGSWSPEPSGPQEDLSAVGAGNGIFAAVGSAGTALVSADGETWAQCSTGTARDLTGIAYGSGMFVAVGSEGSILHSTDGTDWMASASGTSAALFAVCHGADGFVAVGQSGIVLHSADGSSWTMSSVPGAKGDFLGAAYGNGIYVAVGQWGQIATSPDGLAWTMLADDPATKERWYDITGIAFGNGVFVTSTRYRTTFSSSDGLVWTKRTAAMVPGYDFHAAVFLGGIFAVAGDGGMIQTSPDGTAWTDVARSSGARLRGGASLSGRAVFVGDGGVILATARGILTQPSDTTVSEGSTGTLTVVAEGTGPFSYQWYRGLSGDTSSPVSDATASSLSIDPGPDGGAFWVRVIDGVGSFDSRTAAITIRGGWTAYHAGWAAAGDAANTTTGAGNNTVTLLKNSVTGASAGNATIKYAWTGTYNVRTDNKTGWQTGTDAHTSFHGFVGLGTQADNVSASGNSTITLGGLNVEKTYELTVYAGRDSSLFSATNLNVYELQNATVSSSAHSSGVTSNGTNSASVAVGLGCKAAGRIVRWTFRPTSSNVVLRTTAGGGAANSVIPQAVRLSEISEKPVVTQNPAPASVTAGTDATLTANVAGSGLSFQWFRRDIDGNITSVPGATGALLNLSTVTESAEYFVRATGSGGSVDSAPAAVIATLTYSAWADAEGLPSSSGAIDSDADGTPNMLEFAMGMDPNSPSPAIAGTMDDGNNLVVAFSTTKESAGVTIVPETSQTLAPGSWQTTDVTLIRTATPSIIEEQWEARVPVTTSRRFLRLRATTN